MVKARKIETEEDAAYLGIGRKRARRSDLPSGSPEFPESQSDRERGRFRPSGFDGATQVGVCNDDGTPIGEGTESRIASLIDETQENRALLEKILAAVAKDEPEHLRPFFDSAVTSTVETWIMGPTVLYYLEVQNPNAADAWLQLFDDTTPTLGTSLPKLSIFVPGLGSTDKFWAGGIQFKAAIRYAATTTSTGSTAPTSNLVVNGGYV